MAKEPDKKRKSAAPRGFRSPAPGSKRKFVDTTDAVNVMERLLRDLNKAKSGETGWNWVDTLKVEHATFLLELAIAKLTCPPKSGSTLSQSYPRP